jgi:hypothetical protein
MIAASDRKTTAASVAMRTTGERFHDVSALAIE